MSGSVARVSDVAAVPLLTYALLKALRGGYDCRTEKGSHGEEIHSGPHIVSNIAVALGNIGDQAAVSALIEAQSSNCKLYTAPH